MSSIAPRPYYRQYTRLPPYNADLPTEERIKPTKGKVYYLPDGRLVPQTSIVHIQKRQDGFFRHPVMVTKVDESYAYFYALTKRPPRAIEDLGMCLRLGNNEEDDGEAVLRLGKGSQRMELDTWLNLEQLFNIEWELLDYWRYNVFIAPEEFTKLDAKIEALEATQNRFIYKPLHRDLSKVEPGIVLMLPNRPGASTLGAPILVLKNEYPMMRFLRIKATAENHIFQEPLRTQQARQRRLCLKIRKELEYGHDGTPVMLLAADSPTFRVDSYVEVMRKLQTGSLKDCKTWCWPPIVLQPHSVTLLMQYVKDAFSEPAQPQPTLPQPAPPQPRPAGWQRPNWQVPNWQRPNWQAPRYTPRPPQLAVQTPIQAPVHSPFVPQQAYLAYPVGGQRPWAIPFQPMFPQYYPAGWLFPGVYPNFNWGTHYEGDETAPDESRYRQAM